MGLYSHYILPRALDIACSNGAVTEIRQAIVPEAEGTVVEVGIGSGLNLPHYDPAKVTKVIGIDPDDQLWRRAEKRCRDRGFAIERLGSSAESIALDNDVADTVVVTFSLCSIPMPVEALTEMRRVLKPGGRLLFAGTRLGAGQAGRPLAKAARSHLGADSRRLPFEPSDPAPVAGRGLAARSG